LVLLAFLFLVTVLVVPFARAQSGVTTIAVVGTPQTLAYDPGKGEVFAVNLGPKGSVISANTDSVVADLTLPAGSSPEEAAYDQAKGEIFVADSGNAEVSVISDSTNKVVASVGVGGTPDGVAYDSGKGEVFVANGLDNTLSVISDSNNTVVATITLPNFSSPEGLAYDPAKGEVFVADNGIDNVSVVSDSTNQVVTNVGMYYSPTSLVYDSGKGEVFVDSYGDGFAVISDSNNAVVAYVPLPEGGSVGAAAYDPAEGVVIAGNYNSNTISAVSDSTNKIVANVMVGSEPYDVVYDTEKGETFVAISGSSSVAVVPDAALTLTTSTSTSSSSTSSSSSSSSTTSTTTSSTSSSPASTSSSASSTTSTSTSSASSGSGGVPEFPYQLAAAGGFTVLLAASYLLIRRRMTPRTPILH
jgi:YVTN family beta-propeller protein